MSAELSVVVDSILGDSLIHNDRGNGAGGPGYEDSMDVRNEIERGERDDLDLVQVLESEDAEAWDLARDAFRACDLNPADVARVWVGERADGDNGHQMIYAA